MPLYEFKCEKCELVYEELVNHDKTGKYKKLECPVCGSHEKERLMSACSMNFTNPVGTKIWTSESGGHDYRFRHNLPNVRKQRADAEVASHMGKTPYRHIDDISSGRNFGEVK